MVVDLVVGVVIDFGPPGYTFVFGGELIVEIDCVKPILTVNVHWDGTGTRTIF
jgi:hypothetical protein